MKLKTLGEIAQQHSDEEYTVFWEAQLDQMQNFKGVQIRYLQLYELIKKMGYCRIKINDNPVFIEVVNSKIVKEVTISDIKTAVLVYLDELPEYVHCPKYNEPIHKDIIREKLIRSISTYFDKEKLDTIRPERPIIFNRDSIAEKYIYFSNGYLHITPKNILFRKYDKLPGYIWETEIIPKDFELSRAKEKGDVARFFELISGKPDRTKDLMILAGYLIHSFSDYKLKAVMLTDSTVTEGEANGRTGKTLFGKLVGGILTADPSKPSKTFVEVGAKSFDPADKHKYDRASYETKLIMLNDLKRNFDVDALYNDITDGQTVNKKNQQPFVILAKMILTTNKTVKLEGASSADRFVVFEFSNYFSDQRTPEKEFGKWFFRDWETEDWHHYYYFMARCAQEFLKKGSLPRPESINLERRMLLDHTSREFVEFVEQDWLPEPGLEYSKKAQFESFIDKFPDWSKLPQRRFTEWIKAYMNHTPKWENFRAEENEGRDREGNRWIKFIQKKSI